MREIGDSHDPTAVTIQKEIGGVIVTTSHNGYYDWIKIWPSLTCSIIYTTPLFALLIADNSTSLLNGPCGSGNFL